MTTTLRPRSFSSVARASVAWGMSEARWNRGVPPSDETIVEYSPRAPTDGLARYMTVVRLWSSPASAARTATVLPAPTSPVTTPRARSSTHQVMRATASAWLAWVCSIEGARSFWNGMRVKPQCARSRSMVTW